MEALEMSRSIASECYLTQSVPHWVLLSFLVLTTGTCVSIRLYFWECHNLQDYRMLFSSAPNFRRPNTVYAASSAVPAARCTLPLIIVLRLDAQCRLLHPRILNHSPAQHRYPLPSIHATNAAIAVESLQDLLHVDAHLCFPSVNPINGYLFAL